MPETTKLATLNVPELGLYVNAPVSSNKASDSSLNTTGKAVSVFESVTVTSDDVPVTSPVILPAKAVAVNNPVLELNVKLVPDLGAKLPVAAVTNNGKHVVSEDSSATVTVVAIAAVPVVSWLSVSTDITPELAVNPVPANKVAS